MEIACFEAHGQVFGIEVQQICEVVRCQALTPLPKAPDLIEGLMDLRGAVFPVVDLGRALALGPVVETRHARIAIVEVEDLVLGLRVQAATEVLAVDEAGIQAPPAGPAPSGGDAVRAVVRREGTAPVLVLSLEHLVARLFASSARAGEGTA